MWQWVNVGGCIGFRTMKDKLGLGCSKKTSCGFYWLSSIMFLIISVDVICEKLLAQSEAVDECFSLENLESIMFRIFGWLSKPIYVMRFLNIWWALVWALPCFRFYCEGYANLHEKLSMESWKRQIYKKCYDVEPFHVIYIYTTNISLDLWFHLKPYIHFEIKQFALFRYTVKSLLKVLKSRKKSFRTLI